ncbi:hypothetical protein evm_001319 [Chilo suppressalis]|nr:hypothetical protein evm_001319 [Chilo suppressalis]
MMQGKWILVFILNVLNDVALSNNNTSKEEQIKQLEKLKSELYSKISEAIEDGVKALEKTNDTDSLLTADNIKQLQKQIDTLNATFDVNEMMASEDPFKGIVEIQDMENPKNNSSDIRRASEYGAIASSQNDKVQIDLKDIIELLKKNTASKLKHDILVKESKHDLDVKKTADEWILARKKEKEKIRQYREQRLKYGTEKCPRFGNKIKKKKITSRRKKKKKDRKKPRTYPCCRKCCKKSYMGCL